MTAASRFIAPAEALTGPAATRAWWGRRAIRAAADTPHGAHVIDAGEWAGFTRAEAIAWTWNLYQYEPIGFGLPCSPLSFPDVKEWLAGGIPASRDHAERARRYEAAGISAEVFRTVMEISDASRRPSRYGTASNARD